MTTEFTAIHRQATLPLVIALLKVLEGRNFFDKDTVIEQLHAMRTVLGDQSIDAAINVMSTSFPDPA